MLVQAAGSGVGSAAIQNALLYDMATTDPPAPEMRR